MSFSRSSEPTHQALEGGRLIWRIVVHVHPGMSGPRIHDQSDDLAERARLVCGRQRPTRSVDRLPCVVQRYKAEQILATVLSCEGIAFQVKKQITGRGLRQSTQTLLRLDWLNQLEHGRASEPRLDLKTSLLANPNVRLLRTSPRLERQRQRSVREFCDRPDVLRRQFSSAGCA